MVVYRLIRQRYQETPLSAEGAFRVGGRWNPPGYPILYTSATPELALLEVLVHLNPADQKPSFCWVVLDVPDPGLVVFAADLDPNWYETDQYRTTQVHLRDWLSQPSCITVQVPSAVVELSANYLIHAIHPSFTEHVHLLDIVPCRMDSRLLKAGQ